MTESSKLIHGGSLEVLKTLDSESVDCVICSPPYYGLRNYGIDGQIGLEKTPQDYIHNLMNVFTECKRVLKKAGSLWVNIGDTYSLSSKSGNKVFGNPEFNKNRPSRALTLTPERKTNGIPNKSLIGIPERFVIAMTDAGWIRRNTIIWYKPNCMPSSAKDRFTVDFEYFYFFTKSQKYYFETQYEPHKKLWDNSNGGSLGDHTVYSSVIMGKQHKRKSYPVPNPQGRIKRTVWQISTQPLKEAHFAVFPEKLIETPIKACCPAKVYKCNSCNYEWYGS